MFLDIQTTKKRKVSGVLCVGAKMILRGRAWKILRKHATCLFCSPTSSLFFLLRWLGVKENTYTQPLLGCLAGSDRNDC